MGDTTFKTWFEDHCDEPRYFNGNNETPMGFLVADLSHCDGEDAPKTKEDLSVFAVKGSGHFDLKPAADLLWNRYLKWLDAGAPASTVTGLDAWRIKFKAGRVMTRRRKPTEKAPSSYKRCEQDAGHPSSEDAQGRTHDGRAPDVLTIRISMQRREP